MSKNLRSGRRNLLALALLGAIAETACEKMVVSTVEVSAIQVSPDELSLVVNATERLVAVPMSASGTPMPGHPVTWTSSDPDVATVDEDGMVRAHGPGSVWISATSGGVVEEVVVMVSGGAALVATPSQVELEGVEGEYEGESAEVVVRPEGGAPAGEFSLRLEYPATGPQGWLSASRTSPTTVQLEARPASLEPGSYSATVRVSASSADVQPAVIQVELLVRERVVVEPSASRSTVTADPKRLPANGNASSLITVTLRGANGVGIPVGGHEVVLSTTRGTLGPVTDHGEGTYTARLTSEDDGDARVTATVDGTRLEQRPTIRFDKARGGNDD